MEAYGDCVKKRDQFLGRAVGQVVFSPKETNAVTLGQFRLISLFNVEGKILFSVVASRRIV